MAIPKKDDELAAYSTNFDTRVTATPTAFGLTAAQATAYTAVHDPYIAALAAVNTVGARSKALVAAKNTAKENLLRLAREYYKQLQASLTVSDENKTLLNIKVINPEPTPVPPPVLAPLVTLLTVIGRIARYQLRDASIPGSKRRPANARGALILSYVGENPPMSNTGWTIEGEVGKTTAVVQFPDSVEPGQKCWVTAMWVGTRGEFSPACQPVSAYLQIGPVAEAA